MARRLLLNCDALDKEKFAVFLSHNLIPIVPTRGCFVGIEGSDVLGIVLDHKLENQRNFVKVQWGRAGKVDWHPVTDLRNGLRQGFVVQDAPRSNTRRTLGQATVRAERYIGGRELVLVQLHETGESKWLPFENLRRIKDPRLKYDRAELSGDDTTERFRLKALAYALDSWNQVTGALDRFDVDPLPHQIDIVHRIMTSEHSNWLIADDVGLGKTIEVGLLLAAMKRRRQARRVLVVCPAGVVRQWQDEMEDKFNESFRIYGYDFNVNQASHWAGHDKVIVSIDRAKSDGHMSRFRESGDWDIVVFDEAHHLSKNEHQATTQRYRLAEQLRGQTDSFIFLTGTPHSGRTAHFINILMLLRSDLRNRFESVFTDPTVVSEVVLRNQKSLVTDAAGNFIFRGQDTHQIAVPFSEPAKRFDAALQHYLRNGYSASAAGGAKGRAIGFVMTTYRKLASSSIAAIETALRRRLARLDGLAKEMYQSFDMRDFDDAIREGIDGRDDIENVAEQVTATTVSANPFFDGEKSEIQDLLAVSKSVKDNDTKLAQFLKEIVDPIVADDEKLLIFTEYRATQDYLVEHIKKRYARDVVAQINGGMNLDQKRQNIRDFNADARFMVTTEAGGEGINLHDNCHVLVNYDLPWNPGRLVQRAGRLYRYGQKERVVVFNLVTTDGFDNRALNMMLERVENIAIDMSGVSAEFRPGLETEIVGELLERVDIASLLAENRTMDLQRTESDIDEALQRARNAKQQQDNLFASIEGYDPQATLATHSFGTLDVLAFLEGILPYKNVNVRDRTFNGLVLELELPEEMRGRYSEFPERATYVRVTPDRQLARSRGFVPMDFKSPFFASLIDFATSPDFKGEYASIEGPETGALGLYKLRWQNDHGVPGQEELLSVFLPTRSSNAVQNPSFFGRLLHDAHANLTDSPPSAPQVRSERLKILDTAAEHRLASRCTSLRHPNDILLLAAADIYDGS